MRSDGHPSESRDTTSSTGVLVVGCHLLSRIKIVSILDRENDFRVVGHASPAADLMGLLAERRPDLVVLSGDLDLSSMVPALAESSAAPDLLVVVSSRKRGGPRRSSHVRSTGIKVSLTTMATLLPAARLLRSGYQVTAARADDGDRAAYRSRKVDAWDRFEKLTEREAEIVQLMIRGWDNAEIADALMLSGATVKSHVHNVMTKLELRNRIDVIITAYTSGIIRPGVPKPHWHPR